MLCCGFSRGNNQLGVLENPEKCRVHNDEVRYICLQNQQKCEEACLLCNQCLLDHQKHQWMPLQQYFSKKFKDALLKGTSTFGEQVSKLTGNVIKEIRAMKKKINDKIDQFLVDMTMQLQELKALFPIQGKFGVGNNGYLLNNENVREYRVVCERQKNGDWIKHSENFFMRMIKETSLMICNFFDDFHSHLADRDYTAFTLEGSRMLADNFMKKYEGIFSEDTRYFKLSQDERHVNIRVSGDERQARYVKGSAKPTVLTKNSFNRKHPIIYYQIVRLEKTLIVFDKQLIVIGACIPDKIKTYGYKGAMEPSHGGFGIGSTGRVYHSKLYKYEKADIGFTFGNEDIVSVSIDFEEKMIKFEKKTGYFKKRFEMELDLEDDEMQDLKPFIMFDGQDGAVVRVLEEYQTSSKYQRRLKEINKKRHIQLSQKS